MKIRKVFKESTGINLHDKDGKGTADRTAGTFNEQLQRVHNEIVQQELENLFTDVNRQGNLLGETLNIRDLKKYKSLVQKFLDSAVNKMYRMKEQHGWDRRGRHKIYSMVETVNKELEELTRMLLSEQKDKLEILAKIDEIRGMLVDIYS